MTNLTQILQTEKQKWYEYTQEIVLNNNIQWDDVFLQYDFSPPFQDEFVYPDFEFYKGGYMALDGLLDLSLIHI